MSTFVITIKPVEVQASNAEDAYAAFMDTSWWKGIELVVVDRNGVQATFQVQM